MPNHVKNGIRVSGKIKDIQTLLEEVSGKNIFGDTVEFTFHKIIPMPEDVSRQEMETREAEKLGDKHWYAWCNLHWDTKWDAYDVYIRKNFPPPSIQYIGIDKGEAFICFQSAWSPPTLVLKALINKYTHLGFEIAHLVEGNEYWGKETYKNGELIRSSDKIDTIKRFFRRF